MSTKSLSAAGAQDAVALLLTDAGHRGTARFSTDTQLSRAFVARRAANVIACFHMSLRRINELI